MKGRHKERRAGRPGLSLKNPAQSFRTDTPLGALEPALDVSAALGVAWSHPLSMGHQGGLGRGAAEARTIANAGQAQRAALAREWPEQLERVMNQGILLPASVLGTDGRVSRCASRGCLLY